uniref:Uncharacterized protein n=1 Tax=Opuntia streptacantha TaxID=393608 RepID=A0A7C9DK08_OPUST
MLCNFLRLISEGSSRTVISISVGRLSIVSHTSSLRLPLDSASASPSTACEVCLTGDKESSMYGEESSTDTGLGCSGPIGRSPGASSLVSLKLISFISPGNEHFRASIARP